MAEPFLSIVIPAYNEASRIASSLEAIENYVRGKDFSVETIVVDDGSTDNTVGIASAHAGIRVLRNGGNRGKGFSVRHGVLEAQGELIFLPTLTFPLLSRKRTNCWRPWNRPMPMRWWVLGRSQRELIGAHQSPFREWGGRFFNLLVRIVDRPQHPRHPMWLQTLPARNHPPRLRASARGRIRIRPGGPLSDRAAGAARWWRFRYAGITTLPPRCIICGIPCL